MVRPLGILVSLVKGKIGHGFSMSGVFVVRPYISPFLAIF